MNVVLTVSAERDLEAIGEYIAGDNPVRALSFVRELLSACGGLAAWPEAWPVIARYAHHGIRRKVHGNYLILYRLEPQTVTVLRILNGAADYERLLFPDQP